MLLEDGFEIIRAEISRAFDIVGLSVHLFEASSGKA